MIKEILTSADIPSRPARFPDPPELHAVYFDSTDVDGADLEGPLSITHEYTVELYAPTISEGDVAKHRLESELNSRGIRFATQGWYWLSEIRKYQEIYEFTHIEKI